MSSRNVGSLRSASCSASYIRSLEGRGAVTPRGEQVHDGTLKSQKDGIHELLVSSQSRAFIPDPQSPLMREVQITHAHQSRQRSLGHT